MIFMRHSETRRIYMGYFGPEVGSGAYFAQKSFPDPLQNKPLNEYSSRIVSEGKTRKGKVLFNRKLSAETNLDRAITNLYACPGMSAKNVVQYLGRFGISISETSVRRVAKDALKNGLYERIASSRNPIRAYEMVAA